MTATAIDPHDYVHHLSRSIPYVHPAGRATIDAWLWGMVNAAESGDTATFAMLARRIAAKVDLELQWQAEDAARLGRPPNHIKPKLTLQ